MLLLDLRSQLWLLITWQRFLSKFGDFESIVVGFRPTGNRSFEPQTEELLSVVRFRDRVGVVSPESGNKFPKYESY